MYLVYDFIINIYKTGCHVLVVPALYTLSPKKESHLMFDNNFGKCERILKIGPHLPKLLSNIRWLTFWDTVFSAVNYHAEMWTGLVSSEM